MLKTQRQRRDTMNSKSLLLMVSISTMLSLFGCASIVDKDVQEIEITTIPENCSISIKDKDGENVYTGQTPFKEELTKAKGYFSGQSYDIHIEKGGYRPVDLVVKSRNSVWYVFGNTFSGFIPGWIGVDAKTRSMYEMSPSRIEIRLISDTETDFPGQLETEKGQN